MRRNNNKLGSWIKELRIRSNMTQRQLADVLECRHTQFIANVESGRAPFPSKYVGRFCRVFGVNVSDFVNKMVEDFEAQLLEEVHRTSHAPIKPKRKMAS